MNQLLIWLLIQLPNTALALDLNLILINWSLIWLLNTTSFSNCRLPYWIPIWLPDTDLATTYHNQILIDYLPIWFLITKLKLINKSLIKLLLCKAVLGWVQFLLLISLMSRGLHFISLYVHRAYTTLLIFRFPFLCSLKQNYRSQAWSNNSSSNIL